MRWSSFIVMIVLFLGLRCHGQSSARAATKESSSTSPGFSLAVVPPSHPVRLGSPINVSIIVKNISRKPIPWRSEFADTAYQAFRFLLAQDGHELEKTAFHRRVRGEQRPDDPEVVEGGSSVLSLIQPGKSVTFTIDLARLYEIAEPGPYTLTISHFDEFSKTIVSAKPLTLKLE